MGQYPSYKNPYLSDEDEMFEASDETMANPTVMKVVGVGGAGCNAINRMIEDGVRNVEFIAANTDLQVLRGSLAHKKLQIGARLTKGLGAGAKPDVGEKSAMEDMDQIKEMLKGSNMVFITAGMGGGTGTGAAPVFAKIAKEMGALTVAVVTLPFDFEGKKRYDKAMEGIERLREHVDTMLIISNSRIFEVIGRGEGVKEAFKRIDEVLKQAVLGISSIISDTAIMNVDFADVQTILSNKGEAIMGIGVASGNNRAVEAAKLALENPLIENTSFRNAGAMLVYVIGGQGFPIQEFSEISHTVNDYCRDGAEIITGLNIVDNMKDKAKVIIIATDFQAAKASEEDGAPLIAAEDIFDNRKVIDISGRKSLRRNTELRSSTPSRSLEETQNSSLRRSSSMPSESELDMPPWLRNRERRMG